MSEALAGDLARVLSEDSVLTSFSTTYLSDATQSRGLVGSADAVVLPSSAEAVRSVVAWCYEHGVPITPRGGGTGYAGGAVPDGGVVLSTERLIGVRSIDPLLWRAEVEAGVTTARVHRLARENGLYFPPDPGAADQSHIGGNVATNAGGPHAFKYGVTGAWVTGLEAVVPPGKLVKFGSTVRKDVSGFDLKSLLVGSEGTIAVITAVSLRLIPPPESRYPVVGFYQNEVKGAEAIQACLASGFIPSTLEYLDNDAVDIVRSALPTKVPDASCFAIIAEVDGSDREARLGRKALLEVMAENALLLQAPTSNKEIVELWRWREGVGLAADGALGGKVSEDIVVPVDHLANAITETRRIGKRHGLASCSWGHAGDGNLHSSFLFLPHDYGSVKRAVAASDDLFDMAAGLGGSISGEHGIGSVKAKALVRHSDPWLAEKYGSIKRLFDPQHLLNPGKKAV